MREPPRLGVQPRTKGILERRAGAPEGRIVGVEEGGVADDPVPGVLLLGKVDGRVGDDGAEGLDLRNEADGQDARHLATADLLSNCTSLGMVGQPPLDIDLAALKPTAVVSDAVYVPLETGLLSAAAERGHRVVDGLWMLLHQAGYGFSKWFGVTPKVTGELRALIEADIHAKTGKS